jgi:hypothetical protein
VGADEEISEVVKITSSMGLNERGEADDRASEGQAT